MSRSVRALLLTALPAYYVASLAVLADHAIPQLVFLIGLGIALHFLNGGEREELGL